MGALNNFFPLLDALVFVTDLVTAVLLFSQFAVSGSRPLLALAIGYLFTALIVVPHALTFTGAFSPTGLLGANIQTGSWLFIFWHLGSCASLLTYALLPAERHAQPISPARVASAIRWSVIGAIALTCGLTWLSTAGTYLLPAIIVDTNRLGPFVVYPIWLAILIAAAALLRLAARRRSVLDQWLMVVAFVYIGELAFSGLLPTVRFSLGFYAGRAFSIIAASVMLVVLLAETTRLYVLLARSHAALQREQDNKLMSFEAIVAAIGHEVKQPLGVIELNSSSAGLILDKAPIDVDEMHQIVGEIEDAGRRVNDTLTGFRALFGRAQQTREPVDLNEVIRDVLSHSHGEISNQGVSTRLELATGLPPVYGNKNQLHQLIYNLMHNAVDAMAHTAAGSKEIALRTDILNPDAILVEVRDNGAGIDPAKLDSIFDAFVTTKSQGMGLGLAICRKIVECHGGQIFASPAKPAGAVFRIELSSRHPG